MNTQPRFQYPPQYQYMNPPPNRRQSTVYVSPQHMVATPVNQNFPTYDTSPVDSGIYSLHNFATFRPQTVAGHQQYQQHEFDDDDRQEDDSSPVDVHELVSELRKQITVLSSRIKRFEDRKSVSLEVTSPQPQIMSPVLSPDTLRSPSVTSSGSEGGRKKRSPLRISPNMNHPHPSSNSKYNPPPKFRPDGRHRARELGGEERPVLYSQFSAPNINRPLPISKARSGLSEESRNQPPIRASPTPTTSNILYPHTRHEASQNASNVIRARSSIGTASHSMLPMQKPTTRYRAPPIKPATSVSPQPTSILRTSKYQYNPINANKVSDGYSYDEDLLKKTSRIPRVDNKRRDYH